MNRGVELARRADRALGRINTACGWSAYFVTGDSSREGTIDYTALARAIRLLPHLHKKVEYHRNGNRKYTLKGSREGC
jgi:hypothetical protein